VGREARMEIADRVLWQRSRMIDVAEDESARFLDLAAFAEGRLDPDERERVAEWLQSHQEAADDIAAAQALASAAVPEALPETSVARACAIVGAGPSRRGTIVPFRAREGKRPVLGTIARWILPAGLRQTGRDQTTASHKTCSVRHPASSAT
jgi:anti-sigma factor RsiW